MIAIALRTLRHRPGGFAATFLSAFLGAALLMAFASLLDTAARADTASAESLGTTAAVAGGWCLVIVVFAVTSTLSLAVRQRGEQFAVLRRAGATGPQLRRMIVGEAVTLAVLAAGVAVPAGLAGGRVLLGLLKDTGQVADGVGYAFGAYALAAGFGVTLAGAVIAGIATSRRTSGMGVKKERPRARRIAAGLFLAAAAACAVLTATVMDGKGIDAMQTAGQAGIWGSIGLALLAPELLRLSGTSVTLASAVMPVTLFSGIATGTVYMQGIEDDAAAGQLRPDYARDIQTLNYVVVGMITVFVAIMLVNTLIAATVHRRREFAQLRLAGATRGQVTAMVAAEALRVTVTGILAGSAASLFTILPFGSARAGEIWPDASIAPYAVIAAIAVLLTATTTLATTRRSIRGPALPRV